MPGLIDGGLEKLPTPSAEVADEREAFESSSEKQDAFLEQPETTNITPIRMVEGAPTVAAPVPASMPKDEVTIEVEKVLEDGLGAFYATLPPAAQGAFKKKGEIAATEISAMVRGLNLQFKRALQLVRDWLLTIPGVNRFFLEQEAKIKVDRIRDLIDVRKQEKEPKL